MVLHCMTHGIEKFYIILILTASNKGAKPLDTALKKSAYKIMYYNEGNTFEHITSLPRSIFKTSHPKS